MASDFPITGLDTFATLFDNTDNILAAHQNDRGDAIENLEAKVGINSSAVTTSHDYLLTHLPNQTVNWDAGGVEVRAETFESDVSGTIAGLGDPPFTVASLKVVTNLNADYVDGKHVAGTNGAGEITTNDGSQTLTNKTLTSPDINGGTVDGVTIGASSAPTVTNLGAVATCDINGGTIDGVTIGAAAAPTVTNLGAVATCDINGGTVNGLTSLGCSTGASINEISTDGTMAGNSDTAVPTEKAVKTYADTEIAKKAGITFASTSVFSGTAAVAFTDLDLSATVGANTALVLLKVKPTGGGSELKFRTNGESEDIGNQGGGTFFGGGVSAASVVQNRIAYVLVKTDSGGIIEWSGTATATTVTLIAYIK